MIAGVVITGVDSTKRYESSARVLFGTSALSDQALQVDRFSDDPEREAATNVLLAGSEGRRGVRVSAWPSTSSADLLDKIEVEAEQNANVLQITATDEDPRQAARSTAFASECQASGARRLGEHRRRGTRPPAAARRPPDRRTERQDVRESPSGSPRCERWPTATRA